MQRWRHARTAHSAPGYSLPNNGLSRAAALLLRQSPSRSVGLKIELVLGRLELPVVRSRQQNEAHVPHLWGEQVRHDLAGNRARRLEAGGIVRVDKPPPTRAWFERYRLVALSSEGADPFDFVIEGFLINGLRHLERHESEHRAWYVNDSAIVIEIDERQVLGIGDLRNKGLVAAR